MWLYVIFFINENIIIDTYIYFLEDILEKGDSRLSNNYGPSITTKQLVFFVYYTDTRY